MSLMAHKLIQALWMLLLSALLCGNAEATEEAHPLTSFVIGEYVIVGQEPNGGPAYSGSARIDVTESRLTLKRQRGDDRIEAAGDFETPSPPSEGRVLRFRWKDREPIVMTCLVGSDLDNYPRLTCLWDPGDSQESRPGLEAMFPTLPKEP
jgi:hypothetical protein